MESFDGAKVERVTVFGDSGVEHTALGLPKLMLDIAVPDGAVAVGEAVALRFALRNRGGYPGRDVVVRVVYPKGAFRLLGSEAWRFPVVDESVEGEFTLEPVAAGEFSIGVLVDSRSGGRPMATIRAAIDAAGTRP